MNTRNNLKMVSKNLSVKKKNKYRGRTTVLRSSTYPEMGRKMSKQ